MTEQKATFGKMSQRLKTLTRKERETKQQLEQLQTDVEDQYYDDIETENTPSPSSDCLLYTSPSPRD